MKSTYSQRLIKLADLNHHQTFFAGRCSEYFLESSYFAVAQYVDTKDTVLLVLHGIDFKFPIFAGDIVTFESKVISLILSSRFSRATLSPSRARSSPWVAAH